MFDEHGGGIREFTSNRDALDQPCDRHQKSRGQCRPRPKTREAGNNGLHAGLCAPSQKPPFSAL